MFRRIKEGTLVGQDRYGNKYYENTDLPHGQHRWIEPPQYEAQQLFDASNIPPEWHGWMHSTTDQVPSEDHKLPTGEAIVKRTDVPAHLNTHQVPESVRTKTEWRANPTLNRERGYNIKTYFQTQVGGNAYYVQPGSPMSPVYEPFIGNMLLNTPGVKLSAKNKPSQDKFSKFKAQREALNKAELDASKSAKPVE